MTDGGGSEVDAQGSSIGAGLIEPDVAAVLRRLAQAPNGTPVAALSGSTAVVSRLRSDGIVIEDAGKLFLNKDHLLAPAVEAVVRAVPRLTERLWHRISASGRKPVRVDLDLARGELLIIPAEGRDHEDEVAFLAGLLEDLGVRGITVRAADEPALPIWPNPEAPARSDRPSDRHM